MDKSHANTVAAKSNIRRSRKSLAKSFATSQNFENFADKSARKLRITAALTPKGHGLRVFSQERNRNKSKAKSRRSSNFISPFDDSSTV